MIDSTNRELQPGDIVLSHEIGPNNWKYCQLFVVMGGQTAGGRLYVLNMHFRKIHVFTNRLIKISPEFAQELFDAGGLLLSEAQFTEMLNEHNKMKETL